jgi:Glucodextranase, domain B
MLSGTHSTRETRLSACRIVLAAAAAVLSWLTLAAPAMAITPSSSITTPAAPFRALYDVDNPPGPQTVSGTANVGSVDINCYFATSTGFSPANLASGVAVTGGVFSTTVPLTAYVAPCVLRAVPHNDASAYPPGQAGVAFTGPPMFLTYVSRVAIGPRDTGLLAYPLGELGYLSFGAPADDSLYFSQVVDPSSFALSPQFLAGVGALLGDSTANPGHSDVQVDGADGFDAFSATNGTPGAPSHSFTKSFDPASGDLTLHETNPYVKCADVSCTGYVSAGVELDRTWQTSQSDGVAALTDVWRSTDGHAHSLVATYEQQVQYAANRSSFAFAGSPGFATYDSGSTVTLPHGPGSTYIKNDRTTPDSGGTYAQGAVSYASAPDAPVTFVSGDESSSNPVWTMPYSRTVPAGGSLTLRFSYAQAHALPDVRSWAAAAEQSYFPAVSIAAPSDGSSVTSQVVNVTGSASDAAGLASLTVNGADTPVGGQGAWSRQVALVPGANTITAVATNQDGNATRSQITVTYTPAAGVPLLSIRGRPHAVAGRVRFTLACAVALCRGNARLTTSERLRRGSLVGLAAARHRAPGTRKKTVTIGQVNFAIPAGTSRTISVALNKTGRRLLKRFGKLPARLAIALNRPGGQPLVVKRSTLTLRPAAKHHRRRH